MKFSEIPGHEVLKRQLTSLVQNNRISHALLFLGREGAGALPLSIAFAQYVLCENTGQKQNGPALFDVAAVNAEISADSCGTCASCFKIQQLAHPDLHYSYPVIKKDSRHDKIISTDYMTQFREFVLKKPYDNVNEWMDFLKASPSARIDSPANKQANITVAECDDITHKLSLKSFEGKYKILIMWMPEFLGNAGNKLLKLIEEPPDNTLFIFVAADENSILQTILSRTQLIKVPAYENEEIEKALIAMEVPEVKAMQIAALASGNLSEAFKLAGNTEENWELTIREWLNVCLQRNVAAQIKWIDEVNKLGRDKQKQLLTYFIHLLQQAVKARFMGAEVAQGDFSARLNNMCSLEAQEAMVTELEKCIYYIERNANAKILFHALTIRLYHIIKDNSLILVH